MRRRSPIGSDTSSRPLKKARREGRLIVFIDETGLSTKPHRVRTWAPRSRTPVLRETFGWKSLSVIGAISLWRIQYVASTEGRIAIERLAAYDPELNPAEYIWAHHSIKSEVQH